MVGVMQKIVTRRTEMVKTFVIICLLAIAPCAFAGTSQLDVIGLVPGKSTEADVEKVKGDVGFDIGGYRLICIPEYISGFLSQFLCLFGEDYYTQDTTSDSYRVASNIEVFKVLFNGFKKKYGKPTAVDNDTVTNALGNEFDRIVVVWIDKNGNKLTISNLATKVNEGMLILESSEKLKVDKTEEKKAEKQRNF